MAMETGDVRRNPAGYWVGVALLLLAAALLAGLMHPIKSHSGRLSAQVWQLPIYAAWSLMRMTAAYLISLIFSLSVGIYAATRPRAARMIIPILDILQSIPIVTFFPAALAVAVSLLGGGRFGMEVAAIFLVFTGMAWNMAFSVYYSVKAIPHDTLECAESFGIRGTQRLFTITIPSCIPGLLYNSILSWSAGWFALTACEILTVGNKNVSLPGLGSFIANAASSKNPFIMGLIGVGALLTVVVGLEIFVWRPLISWAQRFRNEMTVSTASRDSGLLEWYQRGRLPRFFVRTTIMPLNHLTNRVIAMVHGTARRAIMPRKETPGVLAKIWNASQRFIGWAAIAGIAIGGGYFVFSTIAGHFPPIVKYLPAALALSFVRIALAYLLSLAWTIPLVLWAYRYPRILRGISSVAQVLASLPAISLTFLVVYVFVIRLHLGRTWGVELAGEFLLMNGVQWYILFNMLGGVSRMPGDLLEACDAMGLSRWMKFRTLLWPAILPSLLTGTITAFGGGWNTLVFSESISYAGKYYHVLGIGWLLDVASDSASAGHYSGPLTSQDRMALLMISIGALILFIVTVNRLLWRPLQAWAVDRFRFDY